MKVSILHGVDCYITDVDVKVFTFSGGEQHVQLDTNLSGFNHATDRILLSLEVRSAKDLMTLVMTKNALDNMLYHKPYCVDLLMLYVPYARQDRVCEPGEAFGVKAFASIINALNFSRVIVADPHSDVTPAVFDRLCVIPQEEIAYETLKWKLRMENFALVSPDGGALKKIFKLSKKMSLDVFCAEKVRDTATGAIVRTDISVQDFNKRNLMIVDDICDGGRTFIELAKVLRARNAGKIELYVTHGIFSKGLKELSEHFDCIHSLNVWEDNIQEDSGVLVKNQSDLQQQIVSPYVWNF